MTKTKVALLIIYNHKFENNIPKLENLYKDRFSYIFHLVPFYQGTQENVIPVYEHSFYFQGYISQAYPNLKNKNFSYFFAVADDLIIHPGINEDNLTKEFNLDEETCFITEIQELHKRPLNHFWSRIRLAAEYDPFQEGIQINNELPYPSLAAEMFKKSGYENKPLKYSQVYNSFLGSYKVDKLKGALRWAELRLKKVGLSGKIKLKYPMVGSYADIFIIPGKYMKKFSHYCGIFAASKLFVEFAIPTAIILCCSKIIQEKDLQRKGKALWTKDELKELDQFGYKLNDLMNNFPENCLYYHPVKLSQWQ